MIGRSPPTDDQPLLHPYLDLRSSVTRNSSHLIQTRMDCSTDCNTQGSITDSLSMSANDVDVDADTVANISRTLDPTDRPLFLKMCHEYVGPSTPSILDHR
jgi:hypothetical protein